MTDGVTDLLRRAAARRRERGTPEQTERRRQVDERNRALQSGPIVRGPSAPKDGTFGGKPS